MIVADTDVLIDALRGRDPSAKRVAEAIRARSLATTAVTVFELLSGARTRSEKVEQLLRPIPVLALDDDASRIAASLRLDFEGKGKGIGMADYLIAAICLKGSHKLLTRNMAHFARIAALALA